MNNFLRQSFNTACVAGCTTRHAANVAGHAITSLATDTAFWFATGDLRLAFADAHFLGIVTNSLTTAATIGANLYGTFGPKTAKQKTDDTAPTNDNFKLDWGLAAVTLNQIATWAAILYKGAEKYGLHDIFTMKTEPATEVFRLSTIFAMAIPAGSLMAWQKYHPVKSNQNLLMRILQAPMAYGGLAGVIGTYNVVLPPVVFAAALLQSLRSENTDDHSDNSPLEELVRRELSPLRLMRTGYALAGLMSLHEPAVATAFMMWAIGFQFSAIAEPEDTGELKITTRNFLTYARDALPGVPAPAKFEPAPAGLPPVHAIA